IHVRGVENLLKHSKTAKIEHFVHISSLGTRKNAASRYHQTKYKAEQAVMNSGLKYTIFRPSLIFGPEDLFVNRFARLLKYNPVFPLFGSGGTKFQPVWVKDLAKCAVDSLKLDSASNQTFEIGGPGQMTMRQILEIIRKKNGYSRRFYPVIPLGLVSALVKLAERVTRKLPVTREQLTMLQEDNTCDNSKLDTVFKIKLTSLEEGIRQYGASNSSG
ncbi:MAG: NAD(P)H-binding protein, partial [candidate division Zixibacteria bacterium]|nr:NAD(P)H-binding protein [candidate division Zixibacteria bacterium]